MESIFSKLFSGRGGGRVRGGKHNIFKMKFKMPKEAKKQKSNNEEDDWETEEEVDANANEDEWVDEDDETH
jgi:hypothetical protein